MDAATTLDGVLQVVEEFIADRSDAYWSGVPDELRRPAIATEQQLLQWHHALVRAISAIRSPGSPMQELAVLSLHAAVRVHQIRLKEGSGSSSNEGRPGADATKRCSGG